MSSASRRPASSPRVTRQTRKSGNTAVPKVRRNRSPGNKSRQATASRGSIPTSVPASREPTLPSTANRITADKQRTGNARRTENPSQPTLSGNRGRAADPTGIRNDRLRSSAMVNFRSENAGQRSTGPRVALHAQKLRHTGKTAETDIRKGRLAPPLSYLDVPRLSDERAGSAGTYFTGLPWLSTTTRSPRPSERTPANCVLASPTMTIVIRSKSIYCPITCLASPRVISLSVCSLRLT